MGRLIKRKGKKFRIYSTIAEGFLTPWVTRDQAIDVIVYGLRRDLKEKIKDLKRTFPRGYVDYDTNRFIQESP